MSPHTRHDALVRDNGSVRLGRVSIGPLGDRDVLVALSYVGICGTDLQILNGSRPDSADILGHEGVGIIAEAGRNAQYRAGTPVVFNPAAELAEGRILGHNIPGLFQQFIVVSGTAVDRGLVLPVDAGHLRSSGTLIEPLGSILYGCDLICQRVGDLHCVAVFGAGPIGSLATIYLQNRGVLVLLIHPRPHRLETVVKLRLVDREATVCIPESMQELQHRLLALNKGARFDAALICTSRRGAPEALRHALATVRHGGCIDLLTNYPESAPAPAGISTEALRAVRSANICGIPHEGRFLVIRGSDRDIAITSHRGTSRDHLLQAMLLLETSPALYDPVVTHTLSLPETAEALQTLAGSRERLLHGHDCIKAVIDMGFAPS